MIISDGRKIKVQNFGLYPISANRVVLVKGKTVILAEPDDVNITKYPLAIALQPFEIGSWGEVVLSGSLLNVNTSVYSDFNNTILYLGAEGVITATPSNVSIGSISKLSDIEGEIFINFSVNPTVAWGDITGDIVDQTDLQDELNARVPYTGADHDVDLGEYKITMNNGTTDTQMSPDLFGVETNGGTRFSTLEYNGLNVTDSTIPSTMNVSPTGITFPDTSFQETAFPPTGGTDAQYIKGDGTLGTLPTGGGIPHGTTSGTDTYTTTITGVTAYNDADAYLIRFTTGNTTSATLNINNLGAIALYRNNDGALIGGDIIDGAEMLCIYNSSTNRFQVIGTAPNTLLAYVTNAESTAITKGQPVYAFGGQGDRLKVKLAYNTGDPTSAQTVGLVVSTSIGANQKGLIMVNGQLDGLSLFPTSTWADGDAVYLGETAGTLTKTKPHAPNHLVYLGFVTNASNGSAGRMYVRVQNGYEMDELHDVSAQTPSNNDGIFFNTSTSLWESKSIATVLGYTPQEQLTLTTTGNSGPATLSGGALNIPEYTFTGVSVYVKNNTTYSSVSTGSQIIHSLTIPANTFIAGDVLRITARFKKVGGNSTSAASVYINNSVSLSGGKIVRSNPFAAGTLANGQQGTVVIINATNLTQLPPTPSSATDIGLSTSAWVDSTAIDWTATQYLIFSCAPNSALDVVSLIYYQVEKL